ncbi:DegV family protein [Lapidilactobacillus salsurivasis]
MTNDYVISCCSTADLTEEHFRQADIHYIPFHFELDGKSYPDDLGKSMPFHQFYQAMANGAETKTSQVNVEEFTAYFEKFLQAGQDILHVTLSSGLSGVINSANLARNILAEKYPERKIYIVDSLGASSGYGLIMDKLSELRAGGMGIDELHEWVEAHKLNLHHWFFSTDLSFYVKGGRISKTSGFVGGLLGICPLLNMDKAGHLIPRSKIRGKKRVIQEIVKRMEEHADDGLAYADKCFISQSDCLEDAQKVAELIEGRFPNLKGHVEINYVGTTIGSHTGPGTVALFFWGDRRND